MSLCGVWARFRRRWVMESPVLLHYHTAHSRSAARLMSAPAATARRNQMLKGIAPCIGPELLATLARMGHGDEIVLADAHFPGETVGRRVIRADGVGIPDLLAGVLQLMDLDSYVDAPVAMMDVVAGDTADPAVEASYRSAIDSLASAAVNIEKVERFAFYERSREAFAVVMTGATTKYANIILRKGVIS